MSNAYHESLEFKNSCCLLVSQFSMQNEFGCLNSAKRKCNRLGKKTNPPASHRTLSMFRHKGHSLSVVMTEKANYF